MGTASPNVGFISLPFLFLYLFFVLEGNGSPT